LSSSSTTTFNQLFTGSVYEFIVSDHEGDTPTVSFTVNYKSAAIANADSPFTLSDSDAPKYEIKYDPTEFSG